MSLVKKRVCLFLLVAAFTAACSKRDPAQAALEKQFQESMTNATLAGNFTVRGRPGQSEDRYTITGINRLAGDTWIFRTRIQYGGHDVTVPVPIAVKWAGDTPVITLTDTTIPGLGTFSARVLIYKGQYAGTWSHGEHGGQLFGRIEKGS
jgi:hypothetical protein